MTRVDPDQWVYIYGLRDPRDKTVRYVGSAIDPTLRLRNHLDPHSLKIAAMGSKKKQWLNELLTEELRPQIVILERVRGKDRFIRETYWIEYYINRGSKLVNGLKQQSRREVYEDVPRLVFKFIVRFIEKNKQPPTYKEIADGCDLSESKTALVVRELVKQGLIYKAERGRRAIEIVTYRRRADQQAS